jgi:hypothetical protein
MAELSIAWWQAEDQEELHSRALAVAERLRARQYEMQRALAEHALFLYLGGVRVGLSGGPMPSQYWDELVPFFNLVQTATDWFTSTMVRNQIRPFILTQKGDTEQQAKAQAAMKATEGVMRDQGVWGEKGMLWCQDGHLFAGGGLKWAPDFVGGRVVSSRVRSWEFWVPEREARLGEPRQATHGQSVERGVLAAMFDEDSEEHEMVMGAPAEPLDSRDAILGETSDMVLVYEMWHLPSAKPDLSDDGAFAEKLADRIHDGRRVMILKSATGGKPAVLLDEPWPFEYFPVSWYRPWRDPAGYWSRSLPETLASAQSELIDIGEKIQSIMRTHSVPHLLIWENAKINLSEWTNDHAAIIKTRVPPGQAAQYLTPQSVPAELFQREQRIIDWAQKQVGVTDMALSGEKPPGLEHAPGMEHLAEMTMQRHTRPFQAWERAHTDAAKIIIDTIRMMARDEDADLSFMFGGQRDLEEIKWKDMDLERDKFLITVQPTSLFAQTPTAKFRQVEKMIDMGVPVSIAMRALFNFPDAEALLGDQNAEEENIKKILVRVASGAPDEETIPHPYLGLELAQLLCKQMINRVQADAKAGESDDAIDRLSRWWDLVEKTKNQKAIAAGAAQGVATGAVDPAAAMAAQPGMPPPPGGMPPSMPPPGMPPGPPMPAPPM